MMKEIEGDKKGRELLDELVAGKEGMNPTHIVLNGQPLGMVQGLYFDGKTDNLELRRFLWSNRYRVSVGEENILEVFAGRPEEGDKLYEFKFAKQEVARIIMSAENLLPLEIWQFSNVSLCTNFGGVANGC